MNKVKKFLAIIENLIFMIFCMIVILFLVQLFCFTSFKIPSDSMGPALKDGDRILVNKMIKGARLFNVFAALDNKGRNKKWKWEIRSDRIDRQEV